MKQTHALGAWTEQKKVEYFLKIRHSEIEETRDSIIKKIEASTDPLEIIPEIEREMLEKGNDDLNKQAVYYYAVDSLFKRENGHFVGYKDFCKKISTPIARHLAEEKRLIFEEAKEMVDDEIDKLPDHSEAPNLKEICSFIYGDYIDLHHANMFIGVPHDEILSRDLADSLEDEPFALMRTTFLFIDTSLGPPAWSANEYNSFLRMLFYKDIKITDHSLIEAYYRRQTELYAHVDKTRLSYYRPHTMKLLAELFLGFSEELEKTIRGFTDEDYEGVSKIYPSIVYCAFQEEEQLFHRFDTLRKTVDQFISLMDERPVEGIRMLLSPAPLILKALTGKLSNEFLNGGAERILEYEYRLTDAFTQNQIAHAVARESTGFAAGYVLSVINRSTHENEIHDELRHEILSLAREFNNQKVIEQFPEIDI